MTGHLPIIVDAGRLGQRWLTPGRVLRALHRAGGIPGASVATLRPLDLGRVEAWVPTTLATALLTPLPVRLDDSIVTVRRPDDPALPPRMAPIEATVTGEAVSPGAWSKAIAAALGDGFGAEDVGLTVVTEDRWLTQLPPLPASRLPESVSVGASEMSFEGGKKKP